MVVHAVGPTWHGGTANEEIKLQNSVYKCLTLAHQKHYSSIALPAISAGIFGYPLAKSVETIVTVVQLFFHKYPTPSLKSVYLCDNDTETVKTFVKALVAMYGPQKVKLSNNTDVNSSGKRDNRMAIILV